MEWFAPLACGAGDIDNAPIFLSSHERDHLVAERERAIQVNINGSLPLSKGHLSNPAILPYPGGIDKNIDTSQKLCCFSHCFLTIPGMLQVASHCQTFS